MRVDIIAQTRFGPRDSQFGLDLPPQFQATTATAHMLVEIRLVRGRKWTRAHTFKQRQAFRAGNPLHDNLGRLRRLGPRPHRHETGDRRQEDRRRDRRESR